MAVFYIFIAGSEETQERESFMCIHTAPKEPEDHLQNYNANIVFFDGLICYKLLVDRSRSNPFCSVCFAQPRVEFLGQLSGTGASYCAKPCN